MYSGENQKNYDQIFINNLNNNNNNLTKNNLNNLNSFKPCGSSFNTAFNNNNVNNNNYNNFEANHQMNVKIIKADDYIKHNIYNE